MRTFLSKICSDYKVWCLRRAGARIGDHVVIKKGAKIQCTHVDIGDHVVIAEYVSIQATHLKLGKLSFLGAHTSLRAKRITFGENVFVNSNVEIGGGGAADPESEIEIGSHCHIGEGVHLNCCRKITIGEETTVSMRSMVMTHAFANSVLEGYPAVFSPVVIGDHVQIGLQVVIFPGVTVGDGAVIGSNSSVISSVPQGQYAVGVPAKVVGSAKKELKPQRRERIAFDIVTAFLKQLASHGTEVVNQDESPFDIMATIRHQEGNGVVIFSKVLRAETLKKFAHTKGEKVAIVLRWEGERIFSEDVNYIELLDKEINGPGGVITDSIREFLRKRGIRLEPRTWSYGGGLI